MSAHNRNYVLDTPFRLSNYAAQKNEHKPVQKATK